MGSTTSAVLISTLIDDVLPQRSSSCSGAMKMAGPERLFPEQRIVLHGVHSVRMKWPTSEAGQHV